MVLSMKDIANDLHLSKTTVSWILSGKGEEKGFSDETIKFVKDYAEKNNYRPNLLARSLSTGFTYTIGLIVPFIGDTFYAQMAQSIEAEAGRHGYLLTICSSEGSSKREIEFIKLLRSKQVDGLIIAPTNDSKSEIKKLKEDHFPFLLIDRYFPQLETNYIVVNNRVSSTQLVNVLINKGCKKIAVLTTALDLFVMNQRIEGYKDALKGAECDLDEDLVILIQRDNYKNEVITKLDALFEKHPDIDGFYFTTHYLAIESIRYFISKKINYLEKFALSCFHDTEALDILAPKMTIARMPIEEMGKNAVEILLDNITQKTSLPQNLILDNDIIN